MVNAPLRRLALLLAGIALATPAAAQMQSQSQAPAESTAARATTSAGAEARVLRAAPAVDIQVDGRLDEAAWAAAAPATDFVQQRPNAGQPASERTEARVLYTADAIYVGMRMYDAHPDSILGQLTRRDAGSTSDGARVFIDSYHDKRTAFVFGLNPKGVKDDFLRFDDGGGSDSGWDAVWDGAARVDSAGWVAEFRIPLSQLRFNASTVNGGGKWGVNFRRYIARRDETVFWSDIPPNANAFVSLFGELEGLTGLRQAGRMELMPYTSARVTHGLPDEGNPFWSSNEFV
ncbi:MAG TPA: carbohydrate binding family 9 domain-containing protein, partial [Longimicrobiaceae bacterium]|nr:carbohydrate binding family 9 domain-containing protein [Longimicrobiaceae bacterium]